MNDDYEPSLFGRFAEAFTEGGIWMYPITLLGCLFFALALVFVVVSLVSKTNRALPLSIALLVLAVLPAGLGALAAQFSRAAAEEAIAHVDPLDQATIRAAAESESLNTEVAGLGAALVPAFIGCLLLGLGLSRLDRFKPG
jgi:hypothetical protein